MISTFTQQVPVREHAITRVELFTDAALALAATLLIVTAEPPQTWRSFSGSLGALIPLLLAFFAIYGAWLAHTTLFRRYPLRDNVSLLINGLFVFGVMLFLHPVRYLSAAVVGRVLGPGASNVIATPEQLRTLFITFALGWIAVFLLLAWLYQRAYATRDSLSLTPVEGYDAITSADAFLGAAAAGVLSLILAWANIGVMSLLPAIAYVTAPLFATLVRRRRATGRNRLAETVASHPQLADTAAIPASVIREALK